MTQKSKKDRVRERERLSTAAYRVIDIESIPEEHREQIMDDANGGGGLFGLRVVEIAINGPAQFPIYGVYDVDDEKWGDAQEDFGFTEKTCDSDEDHEAREKRIADEAAQKADAAAAAAKAKEDAELEAIGKGAKTK